MKNPQPKGLNVRPFEEQGHFTTMHNLLLDVVMPRVSDPAWKVLCFVVRHTVGYQRRSEEISYAEIMAGTGIGSRTTVARALAELLNEPHGKGKYLQDGNAFRSPILLKRQGQGPRDATRYALNRHFELSLQRGHWVASEQTAGQVADAASGEVGSPQSVPRKERSSSPQNGLPEEVRSPQCVPIGSPQNGLHDSAPYKDRARGKESTKKVLKPDFENRGGGVVLASPSEHEETGPPPPPVVASAPLNHLHPSPEDEVALALCEVCGVDAARPSAVDLDRWPSALERVRAIAEQHAVDRDALLAFRAWWFATPTASGARRQSLYLSNVASHLGQFLQARQAAAEHTQNGGSGAPVPGSETSRERRRRERQEIEQRAEERRAARQAEAAEGEACGPGGAR